jgi:hypothetical protein
MEYLLLTKDDENLREHDVPVSGPRGRDLRNGTLFGPANYRTDLDTCHMPFRFVLHVQAHLGKMEVSTTLRGRCWGGLKTAACHSTMNSHVLLPNMYLHL